MQKLECLKNYVMTHKNLIIWSTDLQNFCPNKMVSALLTYIFTTKYIVWIAQNWIQNRFKATKNILLRFITIALFLRPEDCTAQNNS